MKVYRKQREDEMLQIIKTLVPGGGHMVLALQRCHGTQPAAIRSHRSVFYEAENTAS